MRQARRLSYDMKFRAKSIRAGCERRRQVHLLKLDQAIREIRRRFAEYKFSEVTAILYRFFWSE